MSWFSKQESSKQESKSSSKDSKQEELDARSAAAVSRRDEIQRRTEAQRNYKIFGK